MENRTTAIRLECQWEPSWDDARTRLAVAAEILGFPFYVMKDDVACAYKDMQHYRAENEIDGNDPMDPSAVETYFDEFAQQVFDIGQAVHALYPWFHEGEEMCDGPTGDMTGGNV